MLSLGLSGRDAFSQKSGRGPAAWALLPPPAHRPSLRKGPSSERGFLSSSLSVGSPLSREVPLTSPQPYYSPNPGPDPKSPNPNSAWFIRNQVSWVKQKFHKELDYFFCYWQIWETETKSINIRKEDLRSGHGMEQKGPRARLRRSGRQCEPHRPG